MIGRSLDTSPEAERIQIELLRHARPWHKLHLLGQMNETVRLLALDGLHERHPHATPEEIRRRLADLVLGSEMAERVYGSLQSRGNKVTPPEPISVTLLVIDVLEALRVPYLIGGPLASAVHGVLRATLDADLVVDLRQEHAEPLTRALSDSFYVDAEAIKDAIRRHGSFNLIHLETMFKLDLFVFKGRPFDAAQFERRSAHVVSKDPERSIYVASAEDTILAKLEWYRRGGEVSEHQWSDVLGVLKVQSDRLDYSYLRHWAGDLNVADLLERAVSQAGTGPGRDREDEE